MLCAHCGAPVRWFRMAGGWLHTSPLADFKISRREVQDIRNDPIGPGRSLKRQTYIHPAEPKRRTV